MSDSKSWRAGPFNVQVNWQDHAAEPPRERLSAARIVDTALELMRAQGYDAVSMRSIAKALGTGPASLYAHVANKEQLDQLVVDRIAEQMNVPEPDPERWEAQVKEMMTGALELYRQYPGAARATFAIIPTEPGALRTAEGLLALFRAGGIPTQPAAWAADMISLYVSATAVEQDIWRERSKASGGTGDPEEIRERVRQVHHFFASLPTERFPLVAALATEMTAGVEGERFEFGLTVILEGLKALAAKERA